MRNIIYFAYYLKSTDWNQFRKQLWFVNKEQKCSKIFLLLDILISSLYHGSSFHEYFYYRFYEKKKSARMTYATMGFMYEFQRRFNPPAARYLLADKRFFFQTYSQFIGREWISLQKLKIEEFKAFLQNKNKVVLKNSLCGGGKSVKVYDLKSYGPVELICEAKKYNFDIAEAFIYQHPALQDLSPNSLNTIRIVTQITDNLTVDVIGAILRMGVLKDTDNLSSGGIACKIDIDKGQICSNAISFDISLPLLSAHPVSGIDLIGFQVPFWKEIIGICRKAALVNIDNKSIGWDVAVTSKGPILLEGNHDWGARLWQIPEDRGLKHTLLKYYKS